MHIRPIQPADLPTIADITTAAFLNDQYTAWQAPHRHNHPTAHRRWALQRLHLRLTAPGAWGIVCVSSTSEILGCAIWTRIGDPSTSRFAARNTDLRGRFEHFAQKRVDEYYFHVQRNPALCYENVRVARRGPSGPDVFGAVRGGRWHLNLLAVAPDFQRRGVGGLMVAWGIERCREEAVPATLIASAVGMGLYAKAGFKVVAWLGEELDIVVDGGAAMVWDEGEVFLRGLRAGENAAFGSRGRVVDAVWKVAGGEEDVDEGGGRVDGKLGVSKDSILHSIASEGVQ